MEVVIEGWTLSPACPEALEVGTMCDIRGEGRIHRGLVFAGWQAMHGPDTYLFIKPDGSSLSIPGESFMWYEVRPAQ